MDDGGYPYETPLETKPTIWLIYRRKASMQPKHLITIDWETFYSTEFSLSKMCTQEYILSPHFEVIGLSVKLDDEGTVWFSGSHEETLEWLQQFPWDDATVIAHNANFDGAILEWVFGIKPARYFCTMMGSRPNLVPFVPQGRMSLAKVSEHLGIGQKGGYVANAIGKRRRDFTPPEMRAYAEYCVQDTNLCRIIYDFVAPDIPEAEQELLDATLKKYIRPQLLLDKNVLLTRQAQILNEKANVLSMAGLADRSTLMSNDMFAQSLRTFGVEPPLKISPTTGKETYAFAKTDPGMKKLLQNDDLRVQILVGARLKHRSTQEETRTKRFIQIADVLSMRPDVGFAAPLLYYGAHTGRLSGLDKLNLQNLGRGSELRRAITAPPGHKLVVCDLSQIEIRVNAALAGEQNILNSFMSGADLYKEFAAALYGKHTDNINTSERFIGKMAVLGLGYGMGWEKFRDTIISTGTDISEIEARRTVNLYRESYTYVSKSWKKLDDVIRQMYVIGGDECMDYEMLYVEKGAILLPNNMRLWYPDLQVEGREWTYNSKGKRAKIYGAKLCENIVQALARIILTDAELYLKERGYEAALSVHDELIYVMPDQLAEKFLTVLQAVMVRSVPWMPDLPLAATGAIGDNYMECK